MLKSFLRKQNLVQQHSFFKCCKLKYHCHFNHGGLKQEPNDIIYSSSSRLSGVNYSLDKTRYPESKDFINALNCLISAEKKFHHLPKVTKPYNTKAHQQMYNFLVTFTFHFEKNSFKDCRGINSYGLVGSKGIGKSTALRNFAIGVPLLFPKVIPVYISYLDIASNPTLQTLTILEIVQKILQEKEGIELNPSNGSVFINITEALFEIDKYLLIIVDELDTMFRTSPNNPASETLLKSMGELASIGDNSCGRFSVILCGSSLMIPRLVDASGRQDDLIVKEFPLVSITPNMNSSKFRKRSIEPIIPFDIDVSIKVLDSDFIRSGKEELCKAVTFITGSNCGEIDRFKKIMDQEDPSWISSFHKDSESSLSNQVIAAEVLNSIMKQLYLKNKDLLNQVIDERGIIDMKKVISIDWETQFKPLCLNEIEMNVKNDVDFWIFYLADRDFITVRFFSCARPETIYPNSLHMLLRFGMSTETKLENDKKVSEWFLSYWKEIKDQATIPPTLAHTLWLWFKNLF